MSERGTLPPRELAAGPLADVPPAAPRPIGDGRADHADAATNRSESTVGELRVDPVSRTARATVECPECGSTATVDLARRNASDFCAACDYPLFWSRADVVRGADETSEWSLRRLPGTEGRARAATIPCPHCAEPNIATSVTCIRCGRSLLPEPDVVVAAAPIPVVVQPVAREPYRVPAWHWWVAAAVTLVVVVLILVFGSL